MEKDVALGSVGGLKLSFAAGKARAELAVAEADFGASAGAFVEEDAGIFIDKIKAAVEAKSPAALQPAEEVAFQTLKALVLGVK